MRIIGGNYGIQFSNWSYNNYQETTKVTGKWQQQFFIVALKFLVIDAAKVQLRPVRARERQPTCNSKQRTAPAQRPVACPVRPIARVSTSALFLPARRCYTRSSLSLSFQLFRAPSGHSKCLPHRPAQHSIACPAPVSVFVSASLCAALLILPACQLSERA